MHAFMSNMGTNRDQREAAIKNTITTQLSETVKDIQLSSVDNNDSTEARTNLCSIIEAIFLHGLKDSITRRFRRAFADVDEPPQPSFWPPLLVISHRDIIDQISKLSQVKRKEIGRCRAWIRLVLNDSLLSSYLITILRDINALKPYYNAYAYIRDIDELEVAQKLIEGIENIKLNLPYNTTLLNVWPLPTLLLAGIWCPTLRSLPTASCVDIAQVLPSTSSVNSETCSIASMLSHSSGIGPMIPLNEDEALKIIIAKHSDKNKDERGEPSPKSFPQSREVSRKEVNADEVEKELNAIAIADEPSNYGNSLKREFTWSSDRTNFTAKSEIVVQNANISAEYSYNDLIENSYNLFSGSHIRTPDFKEVTKQLTINEEHIEVVVEEMPKEVRVEPVSPTKCRPISLTAQLSLIMKERGLDDQDFQCKTCNETLLITNKINVCSFTGDYYCDNCMSDLSIHIPARILHNWDFKKYSVSKKAHKSLDEIKDHPIIDFKTANPFIYTVVPEMAKLQMLRNQLNYLRAYLYTCREPIIEQLQKQMWPREYMYEHIHQYSISDLLQVNDGTLAKQLEKVVEFGRTHVLNCWLCSQKGFYCEICNNSKLLFPFDTDNVYRCSICSGVYHKSCLDDLKPCPKCERRKKGESLPLLQATLD